MPLDHAATFLRDQLQQLSKGSNTYDQIAAQIKEAKATVIGRYASIFSPEHIPSLTEDEFRSFLLFKNNQHWDSIHRQGPRMTSDMALLRRALTSLVDESKPVSQRLDEIRPANKDPIVKGLGRAVLTAILQIRHPDKYGVLNNTAEDGMKNLRIWPSFPAKASFGEKYEMVNATLVALASVIPIDLWTLDMLWWRIQPHLPVGARAEHPAPGADQIQDSAADEILMPDTTTEPSASVFALESHLQEFLVENWAQTDFGLDWELLEKDGDIVGSYYDTHEVGQIDLLARHKTGKRWLVIELKRNQTSDATVGQLLRYRSWVRENLAHEGDPVRGSLFARLRTSN